MMRFTNFAVAGAILSLMATGCATDDTKTDDSLNAGSGGASAGTGTGGSATGGSATGGSATGGSATGGSATGGSATGGSAAGGNGGGGGVPPTQCWEALSPAPTDPCGICQFDECCDELIACIPGGGECGDLIQCAVDECGQDNQCINDVINEAANGGGACAGAASQAALDGLMAMYGQNGCTAVSCGDVCQ